MLIINYYLFVFKFINIIVSIHQVLLQCYYFTKSDCNDSIGPICSIGDPQKPTGMEKKQGLLRKVIMSDCGDV